MTVELDFFPEQGGYNFKTGNGVISIELDGGFPRKRKDIFGESGTVKCKWVLTGEQYSLFMVTYMNLLNEGTDPALVPLLTHFPVPSVHKVSFDTGSFSYSNRGLAHTVTLTGRVQPNKFIFQTSGLVSFTPGAPSVGSITRLTGNNFDDVFIIGDKIQVIGLKGVDQAAVPLPDVDLDGVFIVSSVNAASVQFNSPQVTSPGWAQLPSMTPATDTAYTVVKIPT